MDERYVEGGKRVMARRDEDSQGERIRNPEDADPVDEREYRRQLAAAEAYADWVEQQADAAENSGTDLGREPLYEHGGEAGGA